MARMSRMYYFFDSIKNVWTRVRAKVTFIDMVFDKQEFEEIMASLINCKAINFNRWDINLGSECFLSNIEETKTEEISFSFQKYVGVTNKEGVNCVLKFLLSISKCTSLKESLKSSFQTFTMMQRIYQNYQRNLISQ